jgi:hypothetical protein
LFPDREIVGGDHQPAKFEHISARFGHSSDLRPSDFIDDQFSSLPSAWVAAMHSGRKPGMSLSILSNIAREAPLGSLLIAFLLGVAVARRR